MVLAFISGAIVGAIVFGLIIRNNPSIGQKLGVIVDKIDDKIDNLKK